ncbi:MAG: hypothetical protein M0006_07420 [Magnetospirillum sp.]|nr:hypothetical protein [Magnetospirillum sp.]
MNTMLERAIAEAARLPDDRQETIARLILEEMEAERGWEERFAGSGDRLAELARRAKAQHARGETTPLIFPEK